MARGRRIRSLLRWVLLGRDDGLRARLRRRLGFGASSDETERGAPAAEPSAPSSSAPEDLEGWTVLVPDSELADGEVIEAMIGDRALAVARVGDEVYALDNVCPHAGGPLGDGTLEGCELTCPWHGWTYDVTDGSCAMDPSLQAETVEVKRHGGFVYVRD